METTPDPVRPGRVGSAGTGSGRELVRPEGEHIAGQKRNGAEILPTRLRRLTRRRESRMNANVADSRYRDSHAVATPGIDGLGDDVRKRGVRVRKQKCPAVERFLGWRHSVPLEFAHHGALRATRSGIVARRSTRGEAIKRLADQRGARSATRSDPRRRARTTQPCCETFHAHRD